MGKSVSRAGRMMNDSLRFDGGAMSSFFLCFVEREETGDAMEVDVAMTGVFVKNTLEKTGTEGNLLYTIHPAYHKHYLPLFTIPSRQNHNIPQITPLLFLRVLFGKEE